VSTIKPILPKGVRDYDPATLAKRHFIFNTLRKVFIKYGFSEIETPAVENLNTLTGKYGEEGDRLIFKILNSGDFLASVSEEVLDKRDSAKAIAELTKLALRYDLTIPFARFVSANRNDLAFPFKRFQIQPVWRADRPQKGRYREFYQCDADVIGSNALLNDAELLGVYYEGFKNLHIPDFKIKLNHRKVLSALAKSIGADDLVGLTVILDKLDKIGSDGVLDNLSKSGYNESQCSVIKSFMDLEIADVTELAKLSDLLEKSEDLSIALRELKEVLETAAQILPAGWEKFVVIDNCLARGLDYYTGCIFEVASPAFNGSLGGGGRYDDLTGMFGFEGMSGVGISFGADRIYDLMEEQKLFQNIENTSKTKVLIANFDEESKEEQFKLLKVLRDSGIRAELYPECSKLKKSMNYADKIGVMYVVLVGESERENKVFTLKNMESGEQEKLSIEAIVALVSK
jgi:histidyl-tRNA synthetase